MKPARQTAESNLVVISMNPTSGAVDQRPRVEALKLELRQRGFEVRLLTDIEQVVAAASLIEGDRKRPMPGLRAVVAAGGDGTVSLLANRLVPGTPLAILPLGTENLLAKYLDLNADPQRLGRVIEDGWAIKLDAGRANGKLFLVMASCGFDADVVQRLHAGRKGHIRHWSYAIPLWNSIRRYRYPTVRMWIDGRKDVLASKWAFVFNVPRYALNLPIAADANPTDGLLDLWTFRGGNLARGLYYLFTIAVQKHRTWTDAQVHQFCRIRLESDDPVPYQLDGDPGGFLPLEIEVSPKALNVLVPEGWSPGTESVAAG